jgi:hypothetical protein
MTVGLIGWGNGHPFALAITKLFDIEGHIDRQPLAGRPTIVRACSNIGVSVSAVGK